MQLNIDENHYAISDGVEWLLTGRSGGISSKHARDPGTALTYSNLLELSAGLVSHGIVQRAAMQTEKPVRKRAEDVARSLDLRHLDHMDFGSFRVSRGYLGYRLERTAGEPSDTAVQPVGEAPSLAAALALAAVRSFMEQEIEIPFSAAERSLLTHAEYLWHDVHPDTNIAAEA